MAKTYWIAFYHSIKDQDRFAEYAKLAGPAMQAAGGKFLARGNPSQVYEAGLNERVVVLEFDSLEQAIAAHDGAPYQEALAVLGDSVEREIRITESV